MTACRQCQTSYAEPVPRFCGRCGADMRIASVVAAGDGGAGPALEDGGLVDPLIGRVIAGRYRVLERIGAGGMGVVYRVEHTVIGKMAALKMLHPMLSTDRELVKRFRTEARAVSLLANPHAVQVFDFGEADGALFMVMELVRGVDLAAVLEREGALPWRRVAPLLMQICEALAEAHEAGIVHRDIKPENVLVGRNRDGRESVKVLDFGLAKLRERPEAATVTARETLLGTPYYMAPEQIRGEEPDARSDIYAVGAMAYRLLTGEYAFDGPKPVAVLTAHLTEPLRPMGAKRPDLRFSPAVEGLVARCLAREPSSRFASADEVRRAIRQILDAPHVSQPTVTAVPQPMGAETSGRVGRGAPQLSREDLDRFEARLRRRGRLWLLGMFLVVAGAVGGGAFWFLRRGGERPVTEEVEPNNAAAQANLIGDGLAVRGHVGMRLAPDTSDRDFYRFRVPKGPVLLRLEVSGLPNMDVFLGVYTSLSDKVAEADEGGDGDGEVLPNLRLEAGEYYVQVREVRVAGQMATENVTDWYTLRATWQALPSDAEAEPDDAPAAATGIVPGQAVTGYLGRAGDVDYFYPRGEAGGELEGRVSGIPGVDVRVVVLPPGSPAVDPAALPSVRGARVFDAGGPGMAETFARVAWPPGGAAPLIVVQRKDKERVDGAAHRAAVIGVDVPYTLLVERTGGRGAPAPAGAAAPTVGAGGGDMAAPFVRGSVAPPTGVSIGGAAPVAVPSVAPAPSAPVPAPPPAPVVDAAAVPVPEAKAVEPPPVSAPSSPPPPPPVDSGRVEPPPAPAPAPPVESGRVEPPPPGGGAPAADVTPSSGGDKPRAPAPDGGG